ncbi:DnaD domain protein [Clostridium sp. DL1XJH146]
MNTFVFKNKTNSYTYLSNIFIDKYMSDAPGEYVKVYLLALRHCTSGELGISSLEMANILNLLESDIMKAWTYWNQKNIISFTAKDSYGNYTLEFKELYGVESTSNSNILHELNENSTQDMFKEIEQMLGRTLSNKELSMYLSWKSDYSFSPEMILVLIEYCLSKGKNDYRYFEKVAISWHDAKISTVAEVQSFIKKTEDKWINIRKVLKYLGMNSNEVMKPQEKMIDKWLTVYNFSLEIIYRACDICFERLNKSEFKYIDAILTSWYKENIKTIEDVEIRDRKRAKNKASQSYIKNNYNNNDPFINREQKQYDLDKIEKTLLGWDEND